MRFRTRGLAIALLVATPALQAQGESHVDSFTVVGSTVTIVATNRELVTLRIDSAGKTHTAAARAVLLDIWIPGARNAIARGAATDSLRDVGQTVIWFRAKRAAPSTTFQLRDDSGSVVSLALGSIAVARLLESLQRAAGIAHRLYSQASYVPQAARPVCTFEMESTRASAGVPERVTSYDDGSYHSIEWSYKNGALSYTFIWNDGEQGCKVTTFHSH